MVDMEKVYRVLALVEKLKGMGLKPKGYTLVHPFRIPFPLLTLIILCVLTATAWGQEYMTIDADVEPCLSLHDLRLCDDDGLVWEFVKDSTPKLYVCPVYGAGCGVIHPRDTVGWNIFLTWRQVEEEPEKQNDVGLSFPTPDTIKVSVDSADTHNRP